MIKIIDGKRYNTDTATNVAYWDNGLGRGDFNNIDETLYLTPKGTWFVWGEGGANSKYAEDRLEPLTPNGAQSWLEEHGMTDELEEYFSDGIEDA